MKENMKKIILTVIVSLYGELLIPAISDNVIKTVHNDTYNGKKAEFVIGSNITNNDITIGLFKVTKKELELVIEYHAKNKDIADFYKEIKNILKDLSDNHDITVSQGCFAIPGVAKGDLFLHPHLPWNTTQDHQDSSQRGIDKQKIISIGGLERVYFINDFQAIAIGTQFADESSLKKLQQGKEVPQKTKLVIGAGNGLGASLLIWDNSLNQYIPSALNYSFTEFGAESELEFEFFKFLKNKTGNIAWGKVLGAGAGGIKLIYNFFNDYDQQKDFEKRRYKNDKFIEYENYLDIFKNRNKSARCNDSVNLFEKLYARIIRNAAYAQSVGSVYITNTVAQEFPDIFGTELFIKKIIELNGIVIDEGSKKYLETYLNDISFFLVTNQKIPLYGAAALCIEPHLIKN